MQHVWGHYDKDVELHKKALSIRQSTLNNNHPDITTSYNNVGNAYYGKRDHDAALRYRNKALAIRKSVLDEHHPDIAQSYNNMGIGYCSKDNCDMVIKCYTKALTIYRPTLDDNHPYIIDVVNNLRLTQRRLGRSHYIVLRLNRFSYFVDRWCSCVLFYLMDNRLIALAKIDPCINMYVRTYLQPLNEYILYLQ